MADDVSNLPIGTNAFQAFDANVTSLDRLVVDKVNENSPDRQGVQRYTYHGIEQRADRLLTGQGQQFDGFMVSSESEFSDLMAQSREEFQRFLESSGYSGADRPYAAGITLNAHNEGFVRCEPDGSACLFYTPGGDTPLPYTTTGDWASESALFSVQNGDLPLRQDLATSTKGAALVALPEVGLVSDALTYFTPEMVGAVGDFEADDSDAIEAILAIAKGRDIRLGSGKKYKISRNIQYAGDVSLISDGVGASIASDSQGFNLVTLTNQNPIISKSLSSSVQIGTRRWSVNDPSGIKPGMLMQVISSDDWYYDPRGVTKKSELHRVVLVVGNVVYVEAPAGDGYNIETSSITLNFQIPTSISIEKTSFEMVKSQYGVGATVKTGLIVEGAYEPRLLDVSTLNCQYTGRFLKECYRPSVIGGSAIGSNAFQTGYGVQFYGCSFGTVSGVYGAECRRVVDISGGVIISRHNTVENCNAVGGGFNSEGREYGWNGAQLGAYNAGFGTHGAADWTTYRNNKTQRLHNAYTCRGGNESILYCHHLGRTRNGFIDAGYGSNMAVIGNIVSADYYGKDTTSYDGGANINGNRADMFIRFQTTYGVNGSLQISDNIAEVQAEFIQINDLTVFNPRTTDIRNNTVWFATISGLTDVYFINNVGPYGSVDWRPFNNSYRRTSGTGGVFLLNNMQLTRPDLAENGEAKSGIWTPTIGGENGGDVTISTPWTYSIVGRVVTCSGSLVIRSTSGGVSFTASLPIEPVSPFTYNGEGAGTAVVRTTNPAYVSSGAVYTTSGAKNVSVSIVVANNVNLPTSISFSYRL